MPEELIIEYCAPTLAGMKTGSLFSCGYECRKSLLKQVDAINQRIIMHDVHMTVLNYPKDRALIYLYRPSCLEHDFMEPETASILKERGYPVEDIDACVGFLCHRFRTSLIFPHEIGCFLGYPPEDVRAFISGKRSCKLIGVWKVYGDEKRANQLFQMYKKCTYAYMEHFAKGVSLERLIRTV